jgi:DNA-nicking Smr family endonuclease
MAVELSVDGTLDLHTFPPSEARELVREYLDECHRRGILEVRIIHGKGSGALRTIVHSVLSRHPAVISFRTPSHGSGWGATVATLEPETGKQ